MLKVLGENYFVDLDEVEKYLDISEIETEYSGANETKVNIIKFEMVKMLMEVLLTENNDIDDKLGMKSKEVSVPFRIAFNTLLNKKLINHY
jgi:hypothetical protein